MSQGDGLSARPFSVSDVYEPSSIRGTYIHNYFKMATAWRLYNSLGGVSRCPYCGGASKYVTIKGISECSGCGAIPSQVFGGASRIAAPQWGKE